MRVKALVHTKDNVTKRLVLAEGSIRPERSAVPLVSITRTLSDEAKKLRLTKSTSDVLSDKDCRPRHGNFVRRAAWQ